MTALLTEAQMAQARCLMIEIALNDPAKVQLNDGTVQAVVDTCRALLRHIDALERERKAVVERLEAQVLLLSSRVPPEELSLLYALLNDLRGAK